MKNAKANVNKSAKSASAKAKTAKAKAKSVEVTEAVEAVVEQTNAPALEGRGNVANVPETHVCPTCQVEKELTSANFSPMQKGGFLSRCKPCQVIKSKEWTDSRADLRKEQAQALRYTMAGIPTHKPDAKTWKPTDTLMTIEHTVMPDGKIELGKVKGGQYFPSRNANEAFAELQEAKKAERERIANERKAIAEAEKAQRDAERAEAKKAREAKAEAEKAQRDAERAEKKAERERIAAENAVKAKAEREQKQAEKAAERAKLAAEKSAQAKADREAKQAQRAADAAAKALAKKNEREQARLDKIDADAKAAIGKLKGQSATA